METSFKTLWPVWRWEGLLLTLYYDVSNRIIINSRTWKPRARATAETHSRLTLSALAVLPGSGGFRVLSLSLIMVSTISESTVQTVENSMEFGHWHLKEKSKLKIVSWERLFDTDNSECFHSPTIFMFWLIPMPKVTYSDKEEIWGLQLEFLDLE